MRLRNRCDLERPFRRLPRALSLAANARTRPRRTCVAATGRDFAGRKRLRRTRRAERRSEPEALARLDRPALGSRRSACVTEKIPARERIIVALDLPDV